MGKDSLRSDESRFRQSERMVAIWEERKRQRAEAATVPKAAKLGEPRDGPVPKIEETPEIVAQIARPDGLALAPIGMFDVARYHRLKKFYAKRKAAAAQRR